MVDWHELEQRDVLHIAPGTLSGRLVPPPSKSCAHRALICASLAGDPSVVSGIDHPSVDIETTRAAMAALCAAENNPVTVDCGESGTTLRLLVPLAAVLGQPATFTGRGRLPERPIRAYADAFLNRGAQLDLPGKGSLPLTVRGRLQPGPYTLPGNVSSQYVSGLLLALPLLDGDSHLELTSPLESAPYVALTRSVMAHFGVMVSERQTDAKHPYGVYTIRGGQSYRAVPYRVEADYSQAAFWLVANHLGSRIELHGLPEQTTQGDSAIRPLLAQMDGRKQKADSVLEIDASQIPDLVPILAVAAAFGRGETRIANAGRLRIKESDRLATVENGLSAIGADIHQTDDGLVIHGRAMLSGGQAHAWNDHRIAMALAIAALHTEQGVDLSDPWCVRKSYPDFYRDLVRLGGNVS